MTIKKLLNLEPKPQIWNLISLLTLLKEKLKTGIGRYPLKKMLEFWNGIPEEFCWHSRAKHLELQRNFDGIPLEYCRRFCPNLLHAFRNYSDEIPLIFLRKEPEFLWNFCGVLMELLWQFLELRWYFHGIS